VKSVKLSLSLFLVTQNQQRRTPEIRQIFSSQSPFRKCLCAWSHLVQALSRASWVKRISGQTSTNPRILKLSDSWRPKFKKATTVGTTTTQLRDSQGASYK
jgi:hypothetical protein